MKQVVVLAFLIMYGCAVASVPVEFTQTDDGVLLVHHGCSITMSLAAPRLFFEAGETPPFVMPVTIDGDLSTGDPIEWTYPPIPIAVRTLELRAYLQWSPTEDVVRKWATFRIVETDEPLILRETVLDALDVSGQYVSLNGAPPQSYPAFWRGFFAGMEFPVSATRLEKGKLILAHRPGLVVQPGVWYETRKAVYGIAEPGTERLAFMEYIAAHRPTPRGLHFNYNSWWTSSVPFTETEILGLMKSFEDNLYKRHGIALDSFAIDMGWSQPHSIWGIDETLFPEGFTRIHEAAGRMRAGLGLWTSPTAFYHQALDTQWAEDNGYETMEVSWDGGQRRLCCLGGQRYRAAFQDRLVEMVTRYGVRHIKLDGYYLRCEETDHGHQPGDLSSEAIAEGGIRAFEAVRAAAPDTWLEATCFGWNPSPWWLFHVNSVIGTYGDDAPHGRSPCPVYRESYTTARDYFNLQGAALLPIPVAAQEVLGVIHQSPDPFLNDAVTTLLRGHAFVPLYINPKFMDEARWKQLAGFMTWARNNADLLAYTSPILPASWRDGKVPAFVNDAPMPREPYGYAHWKNGRGLVLLRNPWIEPATIAVPLDNGIKDSAVSAVSLYPEVRRYARNMPTDASLDVRLAPYETVVLSFGSEAVPDTLPDANEAVCAQLQLHTSKTDVARVEYVLDGPAMGPDWTCLVGESLHALRLNATANIDVGVSDAQLLVLFEGVENPSEPKMQLKVNGMKTSMAPLSSDAGFAASSIPGVEHWAFYGAGVPRGPIDISLAVEAGGDDLSVSACVLATKNGVDSEYPNALPSPELLYLDAVPLLERTNIPEDLRVIREPAPVQRIEGMYMDVLEPASATQGWGKLERNQSVWEKPLQIAGQRYIRGLGTHAPARIVYLLDGTYRRFQALVGADDATNGTVTFEVWVDGAMRWESKPMSRADAAEPVDVDITDARQLELRVGDAGDDIMGDHADWVDARLLH
jgi:hypothetical protein